jgi:hypothetical protein
MLDKGSIEGISQSLKQTNQELKELITEYAYLNKSHKVLMHTIKSTINQVDSYYESNNELVHTLIQRSGNVKRAYEEMNALMMAHQDAIIKADESMSKLSEEYEAPKEKIAEVIEKIMEMKKLQEEVEDLKSKGAENDEKKIIHLCDVEDRIKKINQELQKTGLGKSLLKDYENGTDNLKEVLETQKEVKETTESVAKAQKRVTEEIEKGGERLKRWKKSGLGDFFSGLWDGVKQLATAAWDKMYEVDQAGRDFGRNMGMTTEQLNSHTASLYDNYSNLAGKLGMEFKDMYKFQVQYSEVTEKATMLSMDQVGAMASVTRNVGEEAVSVASKNLDVFATSADATIEYLAKGTARAAMEGLNVKKYSEAFAKNIKMASKYTFKEGIDGIQKMTLLSQRLKFDMESIGSAMDKFSTLEGAIEASAKIQVLGGTFAQNFGNPLQAMSEALLDAEGFTKRIIDTVASQARFNSKTGEIDLAPIDKQRLKAYAEALGISYDEVHNMATQSRKSKEIERVVGRGKFSEDELAYLSNKAQFDKQTGNWKIIGVDGETAVSDISTMSKDKLKEIRQSDSHEKMLNSNVKDIKEALIEQAKLQKSYQEHEKGKKEEKLLAAAGELNGMYDWMKDVIMWFRILSGLIGAGAVMKMVKGGARFATGGWKAFGGGGASSAMRGTFTPAMARQGLQPNAYVTSKGLKYAANGNPIRQARINQANQLKMAKLSGSGVGGGLNKALGVAGGVITIGGTIYEVSEINSSLKQQEQQIYEAQGTAEEKGKILNETRKQANESKGRAIGMAATGTAVGTALMATGVGFIPGALISIGSSVLGGILGSKVGEAVTESVDESIEDVKKNGKNNVSEIEEATPEEVVKKIYEKIVRLIGVNQEIHGTLSNISNRNYSSKYGNNDKEGVQTSNKDLSTTIKVEEVKVNVNGQIKLVGEKMSVDIDKIVQNGVFRETVENMINASLKKVTINGKTTGQS